MNLLVSQILASHSDGVPPETIAESLELELPVVLSVIASRSSHKKIAKDAASPTKIPPATAALLQQSLIQTALDSDDERLRARIAMRLVDDYNGRLDKNKDPLKNITTVNINEINIRFRQLQSQRPADKEAIEA